MVDGTDDVVQYTKEVHIARLGAGGTLVGAPAPVTLRQLRLGPAYGNQGGPEDGPAVEWRLSTTTVVNHTTGAVVSAHADGHWHVPQAHALHGSGRGLQHVGDAPGAYDETGQQTHSFGGGAEGGDLYNKLRGSEVGGCAVAGGAGKVKVSFAVHPTN